MLTLIREQENCEHLLGKFFQEGQYETLIQEDTDLYQSTIDGVNNEENIVLKFRKNVFNQKLQKLAFENIAPAAIRTENRGMASGTNEEIIVTGSGREWVTLYQRDMLTALIQGNNSSLIDLDPIETVRKKYPTLESRLTALGEDNKRNVWVISRFRGKFNFEEWVDSVITDSPDVRAEKAKEVCDMMSETSYGNPVNSGLAGFFDRYPRIPFGRATSYTRDNQTQWNAGLPYFQELGKQFAKLLPLRYKKQKACCDRLDQRFVVPGTPFTTITVNANFQTAYHRDAGDLAEGFSNLTTVSNGGFSGGYLVLPEYRVAVDLRPGDLLFVANHTGIHGNTPIVTEGDSKRVSFVCYFRERMLDLGSWEYEQARLNFIESRRLNKNHPDWRPLFNGISPGMWDSNEWKEYLLKNEGGSDMIKKYHPEFCQEVSTLEDFF